MTRVQPVYRAARRTFRARAGGGWADCAREGSVSLLERGANRCKERFGVQLSAGGQVEAPTRAAAAAAAASRTARCRAADGKLVCPQGVRVDSLREETGDLGQWVKTADTLAVQGVRVDSLRERRQQTLDMRLVFCI